jgi:YfiH family protein
MDEEDPIVPWVRDRLVCGFGSRKARPPQAGSGVSARLVTVKQVHGNEVVAARETSTVVEADGIAVDEPGFIAAVKTADCVPVLLLSSESRERWAAAVHAGWRGTLAGVLRSALELAGQAGHEPARLDAAIGPAIGPCCYEVGEEVARAFESAGHAVEWSRGTPRLDLRYINAAVLEASGVMSDRIRIFGPCCRCRSDRYYSFRDDPSPSGRQLSWIGWEDRSG